eukprot:scaffold1953_cov391-Prasinococcus_capsulatus_cf.AAC.1
MAEGGAPACAALRGSTGGAQLPAGSVLARPHLRVARAAQPARVLRVPPLGAGGRAVRGDAVGRARGVPALRAEQHGDRRAGRGAAVRPRARLLRALRGAAPGAAAAAARRGPHRPRRLPPARAPGLGRRAVRAAAAAAAAARGARPHALRGVRRGHPHHRAPRRPRRRLGRRRRRQHHRPGAHPRGLQARRHRPAGASVASRACSLARRRAAAPLPGGGD